MLKLCSVCKIYKETDDGYFPRDGSKEDGWYNACKECRNARRRARNESRSNRTRSGLVGLFHGREDLADVFSDLRTEFPDHFGTVGPADEVRLAALERLADIYPTKFERLVYSEKVARGLVQPADHRLPGGWRSMVA